MILQVLLNAGLCYCAWWVWFSCRNNERKSLAATVFSWVLVMCCVGLAVMAMESNGVPIDAVLFHFWAFLCTILFSVIAASVSRTTDTSILLIISACLHIYSLACDIFPLYNIPYNAYIVGVLLLDVLVFASVFIGGNHIIKFIANPFKAGDHSRMENRA